MGPCGPLTADLCTIAHARFRAFAALLLPERASFADGSKQVRYGCASRVCLSLARLTAGLPPGGGGDERLEQVEEEPGSSLTAEGDAGATRNGLEFPAPELRIG